MSYIKIYIITDEETGDVSIDMKSECTLNELQVVVGYLMAGLASNASLEIVEEMVKEIKNAT